MEIIKNGFRNERLGVELDVYIIEGKEWFKAQDISEFLGYQKTTNMTRNIDFIEENSCTRNMSTAQGNNYDAMFINEFALYEIICKIRKSDIDRYLLARNFQKWVFGDVLPSLRKNGYIIDEKNINKEQFKKLENDYLRMKEYFFNLCDMGKISLGRASELIFGNESELKKRLINLGWLDYEKCEFKQQRFKSSNGNIYELFVCNVSGIYKNGIVKHNLQVSITNAGYVYLKDKFEKDVNLGVVREE